VTGWVAIERSGATPTFLAGTRRRTGKVWTCREGPLFCSRNRVDERLAGLVRAVGRGGRFWYKRETRGYQKGKKGKE